MSTTCAVVTDLDGVSRLTEVPLAAPAEGELLLRLEACGLCGTDLFKVASRRANAGRTQVGRSLEPIVLGHELVGIVDRVGANCPFEEGERLVVAHHVPCGHCRLCASDAETRCVDYQENLLVPGGFSETVLVKARAAANSAFPVPADLAIEQAIFLEPAACVLRGIRKAELPAEPRVLIFGAGSMGLLHLLVVRALHPTARVALVDPDQKRRSNALALGADQALDTDDDLSLESSASKNADIAGLKAGLNPRFDAAFDTVGSAEIVAASLDALRPGGTVILFAHGAPGQQTQFPANRLFKAEQRIVATYSSGRMEQVRAFEMLCSGNLDPSPLVTHRLTLNEFDRAVELCQQHEALKVLLEPQRPQRNS